MAKNVSKDKNSELKKDIGKIKSFLEEAGARGDARAGELLSALGRVEDGLENRYGLSFEEYEDETENRLQKRPCSLERKDKFSFCGAGKENVLIEGDNLAALFLLKKEYEGKIDLIYIDPPYNTQNKDFVYHDSRVGAGGGYRHSQWLSFMEKRLRAALPLLKESGVAFISIDDNEYAQLKLLCDGIFGEHNFIATIIWEKAYAPVNLKKHFSESHDYILCYAKDKARAVCNGLARTKEANVRYKNPDNDPRGLWKSGDLSVGPAVKENVYEITTPSGRRVLPPDGYSWRLSRARFEQYVREKRIWFGPNGNSVPSIKRFLSDVKKGITPTTIWKYGEVGHSQSATQELKKLFGGQAVFSYPKPVALIKRIVGLYGGKDAVVLDFFAGSGTTAQAVMEQNIEDGGSRTFILCTNNENDICRKVTFPRIKLAKEKCKADFAFGYYRVKFGR